MIRSSASRRARALLGEPPRLHILPRRRPTRPAIVATATVGLALVVAGCGAAASTTSKPAQTPLAPAAKAGVTTTPAQKAPAAAKKVAPAPAPKATPAPAANATPAPAAQPKPAPAAPAPKTTPMPAAAKAPSPAPAPEATKAVPKVPQNNGGDADPDNNGGADDGDGGI
jgi:hypothetical protein